MNLILSFITGVALFSAAILAIAAGVALGLRLYDEWIALLEARDMISDAHRIANSDNDQ